MKIIYLSIAILIIIAGCASSSNKKGDEIESYSHLVSLKQPADEPSQPSKVYIDSVRQVTAEGEAALLIHGTFPDACTHLKEARHRIQNDTLSLEITAWRNPDKMCAQVLTPFTFIYNELMEKEFSSRSTLLVNGSEYRY